MICRRPKGRRLCHTAARISVPAMRGRLQTPCAPHVLSRRARPRPAARVQAPLQRAGAYKPRAHRMSSPGARPRPAARASPPAMRGRLQTPRVPHVLSRRTPAPRRAHKPPCNARAAYKPRAYRMSSPAAPARAPPRAQAPLQRAGAYKPRAHRMSSLAAHARAPPRAHQPRCNARRLHSARSDPFLCRGAIPAST